MASGVPQTADHYIYEQLNESNKNGVIISEFQFQKLIRKAKALKDPVVEYNCLAALYSHVLNKDLTLKYAVKAICCSYSNFDSVGIDNAVAAIANTNSCKELVEIAKKYPFILECEDSRFDVYNCALYSLDLEYCEMIITDYGWSERIRFTHKDLLCFFNDDSELVAKGSEYINFAIEKLMKVLKVNSIRSSTLKLEVVNSDNDSFLGLTVNFKNIDIDKIIDIEEQWYVHIAEFSVTDDKLFNISFSMMDES